MPPAHLPPCAVPPADAVPDSDEALDVSARLATSIRDEIAAAGGWIPFSRYMALALYAPGLGYYSAGAIKVGRGFGDGSDFVTAPELTPLFAGSLARTVADILDAGGDTVLELGGGSGRLAADLLMALDRLDALPAKYRLLEVSADFRERQKDTLRRLPPRLSDRVEWVDVLPDHIDGAVIANEVLDALPVELVVATEDGWNIRGVCQTDDGFAYADRPLPQCLRETVDATLPWEYVVPGYVTEVHPAAEGLIASLVSRLAPSSVILLCDYGFPESEYYHPQRAKGTLATHRRHRTGASPLIAPGLQDITAHVNFSGVARAADAAGGMTIGYTSQASFLIDCGITDLIAGDASDVARWAPQASALQTLLSEAEMGELFKVIALGAAPRALTGFGRRGRRLA